MSLAAHFRGERVGVTIMRGEDAARHMKQATDSLDRIRARQAIRETDYWQRALGVPNRLYGATLNNEGDAI